MLMKKWIFLVITALIAVQLAALALAAGAPSVSAASAIVIEPKTGAVLYEKNARQRLSMASTTKIMTGLILAEQPSLDKEIVTTDEMVRVEGSSMGLRAGFTVSYRSLLYGLLLVSGNDAANTIAISIAGSRLAFAELMNARAKELGMKDTHFVTPSGLDDKEHYTTAYDMAILAAKALENSDFAAAAGSKTATVMFGNPPRQYMLGNHNRLLRTYKGAIGVKTGFTKKSGRCLVSAADREGKRVIAVTLKASSDWNDHTRMLDYGLSLLESRPLDIALPAETLPVAGAETALDIEADPLHIALRPADFETLTRVVNLPHFLYAPVTPGQPVGFIEYFCGGRAVARTTIRTAGGAPLPPPPSPPEWHDRFAEQFRALLGG